MMTFSEVRKLIRRDPSSASLKACGDALDEGTVADLEGGPADTAVSEAVGTYSIRRNTAKASDIEIIGIDELLQTLHRLPPEDRILIFSFSGQEFIFSVFVHAEDQSIVGCIRVRRRRDAPPSLKEQRLA